MNDLITVIVPVYKVENYIRRCLDSIVAQSYRNLEVILVDDGSPDNCGKICDEYAERDKRIRVIHKENEGLSKARNDALDACKGDYVLCVDSDDFLHRDMVKRLLDAAHEYDAEVVVGCHYELNKDRLLIKERICDHVISMDKMEALEALIKDEDIKSYAWGKLYKAQLFDGVRYPEGRNYEDVATTYLLFDKAKRVVKIPEYLYFYQQRDDSISFNNSKESWHSGCHASCLGQRERAEYFLEKGYGMLYEKAMATLLPYLYSDISTAYAAGALEDATWAKKCLLDKKTDFLTNSYILDKDKRLFDIYVRNQAAFGLYEAAKKPLHGIGRTIRRFKRKTGFGKRKHFDFSLTSGKMRRIVYFELPCFDNLGDHAIAYCAEKELARKVRELGDAQLYVISGWDTLSAIFDLKKVIGKRDIIVCQGGGNFGNLYEFSTALRRRTLQAFKDNKIIIMPQSIFYTDNEAGKKALSMDQELVKACRDITIYARDNTSYEFIKKNFDAKTELRIDTVATYDASDLALSDAERKGILLCLRSDKESNLSAKEKIKVIEAAESVGREKACTKEIEASSEKMNNRRCFDDIYSVLVTDTCVGYDIADNERESAIKDKLRLFGGSRLVITDRLHGMIFAYVTKTPCIVIGNNHHKVRDAYKMLETGVNIRYVECIDDISHLIQEMTDHINNEAGLV